MQMGNKRTDEHICEVLRLARELTVLADNLDADAEDDGCIVLAGAVRDSAFGLRKKANYEREEHEKRT